MAIYHVYYTRNYYKKIELNDEQMKQINEDYSLSDYLWDNLDEDDESKYFTVLDDDFSFDINGIIEDKEEYKWPNIKEKLTL